MKKLSCCSFILLLFLLTGCSNVRTLLQKESPRDKYEEVLLKSGLLETTLGHAWKTHGELALRDSSFIDLPYRESSYFFAEKTNACTYRFKGRRGERIFIKIEIDKSRPFNIFADLFSFSNGTNNPPERAAFLNEGTLDFLVKNERIFLLRLQPELLTGGRYTLSIIVSPSLAFPVKGKNGKAVGSRFGDNRDGGKRLHEGVDIFAERNTPALAEADGFVTKANESGLGGKVVWLSDINEKRSFYYAHLDSQTVHSGDFVHKGDVVGLIGNTGNAKYSSTHLHFGIYYGSEGAVDPLPFIDDMKKEAAAVTADITLIGAAARVVSQKADLKPIPSAKAKTLFSLAPRSVVEITGGTGSYFRVKLPDGTEGFIQSSRLESISVPVLDISFSAREKIWDNPSPSALLISDLKDKEALSVYGEFNNYYFVRFRDFFGWISKKG